jgi:hypothetical protein
MTVFQLNPPRNRHFEMVALKAKLAAGSRIRIQGSFDLWKK